MPVAPTRGHAVSDSVLYREIARVTHDLDSLIAAAKASKKAPDTLNVRPARADGVGLPPR
jgi:hypothetical protein